MRCAPPSSMGWPPSASRGWHHDVRQGVIAYVVAIVLIGAISATRLYLGAHYPIDVLGGWIAGAALLSILVAVHVLRVDERAKARELAASGGRTAESGGAASRDATSVRLEGVRRDGRGLIAARLHRPAGHPVLPPAVRRGRLRRRGDRHRARDVHPDHPVRGDRADGGLEGQPVGGRSDRSLEPLTGQPWTFIGALAAATVGAVVGSLAGYLIGAWGGRPLLDRYGRYVHINPDDLDRADAGSRGTATGPSSSPAGSAAAGAHQLSRGRGAHAGRPLPPLQRPRARCRGTRRCSSAASCSARTTRRCTTRSARSSSHLRRRADRRSPYVIYAAGLAAAAAATGRGIRGGRAGRG